MAPTVITYKILMSAKHGLFNGLLTDIWLYDFIKTFLVSKNYNSFYKQWRSQDGFKGSTLGLKKKKDTVITH